MSLSTGTRVGPYEIIVSVGVGGMGEVYRARDTRLDRNVAVKISAEQFSERFEREARAVAALNHPNVCTLYDVGPNYLVMEFIEGPTLAERIAGGALAAAEALPIARQICEALQAAHDKGIVHRDLKPANIKITPAGVVKVLDFGLAKAFQRPDGSDHPTVSPTLTLDATRAGVILGTAGYMSPEQARGLPADKRADIWSFGVVFFEMLTGRQIFSGETISDTLAAVLRADLQWSALPSDTAPAIRRLLRRCLARDRNERLHDIADARLEIQEALSARVESSAPVAAPRSKQNPLPWILAALALIAALWLAVNQWRSQPAEPSYRVSLLPPDKSIFTPAGGGANGGFSISADGGSLAFTATLQGKPMLWVRRLDSLAARPLPGTENASFPFWSPDTKFIGFFAENKLKKIEVAGGPPQVICDASQGRGGTWNREGVIVFSGIDRTLHRVAASGGQPVRITTFDRPDQENAHYWPSFLPDGRHFLYQARNTNREKSAIRVGSLDEKSAPNRHIELLRNRYNAMYANGWLLFLRDSTLFAQRLDVDHLKLEGDAAPLAEHLGYSASMAFGAFSVSANGNLVYGKDLQQNSRLMWVARDGKLAAIPIEPGSFGDPTLSPDATRFAITHELSGNFDIWLVDLAHPVLTRFTFDSALEFHPTWSPDGKQIAFASTRVDGVPKIFVKASNGAGKEEELLPGSKTVQLPSGWSRDGRYLLYSESYPTGFDVCVVNMTGERKPWKIVESPFNESQGQFSPDGRWISYTSDESGRYEIYVKSFTGAPARYQISTDGGMQSRWRRDGRELYYIAPGGKMMAVAVKSTAETLERETPRQLFEVHLPIGFSTNYTYDVTADGQRFLIVERTDGENGDLLTLVTNWPAALRK
jgi:serine/threonine protein kinase